jgi:hypothetical protein
VEVQVPPSTPSQYSKGFRLSAEIPFFVKIARVAKKWLAGFPSRHPPQLLIIVNEGLTFPHRQDCQGLSDRGREKAGQGFPGPASQKGCPECSLGLECSYLRERSKDGKQEKAFGPLGL